ncbi:MAG: hypothetical protein H6R12_378 [Proteobacteria bacterium]|nr:hypothetical protein [Pseudomonadota bacterium]
MKFLRCPLEGARLTVRLRHGLQHHVDQCRMRVLARHQGRQGRDQRRVAGRNVALEIDHAARKRQLRQVGEASRIGVRLGERQQLHVLGVEQQPYRRRVRRTDHEYGVHRAAVQRIYRLQARHENQFDLAFGHAVGIEQLARQLVRTAAGDADRDPLARQLVDPVDTGFAAVEHPQRLVVETAEGAQGNVLAYHLGPALDETEIHLLFLVQQAFEVLGRTGGCQFDQLDAVALEDRLVARREVLIRAAVAARRDDDMIGWRGLDELSRPPEGGDQQQQRRQTHCQQIAGGNPAQTTHQLAHRGSHAPQGDKVSGTPRSRLPAAMADHTSFSVATSAPGTPPRPRRVPYLEGYRVAKRELFPWTGCGFAV